MRQNLPLLAGLLLACHAAPPPTPPAPPTAPVEASDDIAAQPTPASTERPKLGSLSGDVQRAVEQLAAQSRVTSAKIHEGGEPSEAYAAFARVVSITTASEERALMGHPSPIVRGYLAGHVARFQPEHLGALGPSLRDGAPIDEQHGCMRRRGTVASYVAMKLCDAVHLKDPTAPRALQLLTELAASPDSPVRVEAQRCIDSL